MHVGTSGWSYDHWDGVHVLGDCRGVVLVQLAPRQERDIGRLDYFLYVYFSNDAEGNAVRNARRLRELLCHGAG